VHLTNSGFTSWHGFASGILDHLKRHSIELRASAVIPIETRDFPTKAVRPLNSRLDLSRLRNSFRLETPSWHQALAVEIQYFLHNRAPRKWRRDRNGSNRRWRKVSDEFTVPVCRTHQRDRVEELVGSHNV
jgi:hypothetical protein